MDVDQCQETAASNGVSAMPTFIFFRNKTKIDKIQGADNKALEEKVGIGEIYFDVFTNYYLDKAALWRRRWGW